MKQEPDLTARTDIVVVMAASSSRCSAAGMLSFFPLGWRLQGFEMKLLSSDFKFTSVDLNLRGLEFFRA